MSVRKPVPVVEVKESSIRTTCWMSTTMTVRVMSVRKMMEVTCSVRVTIPQSLVVILKEQTILMPYGKGLVALFTMFALQFA